MLLSADQLEVRCIENARPVVCIQGLGFVGAAMAAIVGSACGADGNPSQTVLGIDLDTDEGLRRAEALNSGRLPFECTDVNLKRAARSAHSAGYLFATTDANAYRLADITVVDIPLDISLENGTPHSDLSSFRSAIETLGKSMRAGSLVLVETTLPPGTCEKIAAPILAAACTERNLAPDAIGLAHSYERVMPGPNYYDSVVNYWRAYAGRDEKSANQCRTFLEQFINTKDYPLKKLSSMTASETAKILENSYRAVNIAFIEEWSRFAEATQVDLFEIIDAIRMRPTHDNIRQPGFGVGGYCLTKDPLFPRFAAREFLDRSDLSFPFSEMALDINQEMPVANLERLTRLLGGSLSGRRLLVLGVAYRSEVDDTRYSPAATFVQEAETRGAIVRCHDPLVSYWPELGRPVEQSLPDAGDFEAVVLAVSHNAYGEIDFCEWVGDHRPIIYDTTGSLGTDVRAALRDRGVSIESTGRGEGL